MDRLTAMESFVRTVERGSFAAAAADRGLSPSMIGNHVRFLEERLGALLLNRTTRQQSVTEAGRAYYGQCRRILRDIAVAEGAVDLVHAAPRGLLRVTAPTTLGTTIMPRIIASYLAEHAEVQVDLVLQEHRLDLLADELDVAIRVGPLPDSGLIARALPPMRLIACASPSYLAARGHPGTPADLRSHNCLDFTHAGEPNVWRFAGQRGEMAVEIRGTLRINNGQALRAAALQHVGIVLQPEVLVRDDLEAGRLSQVLVDHPARSLPLHLLTLPDQHPSPKLRSFVEVVIRSFKSPQTGAAQDTEEASDEHEQATPRRSEPHRLGGR